ncbi:MAG: hypothetical protein ACYC0F_03525 [Rhodanobacter sp.]
MPKTFFDHEQQPNMAQLLEQGMRLWHEEVELRPGKNLERLWPMACELLNKELRRQRYVDSLRYMEENKITLPEGTEFAEPSEMISANTLRYLIVGGTTVPAWWDSPEPYPYQGLFISAFYFLEARNKVEEANAEAAWVSLTQAYYYLGMNSATLTAHESASDAAKSRHAKNSKAIRKIIVMILAAMHGDASINSGAKAMKRVVTEIEGDPDRMDVLNDFDSKSSEKTKNSKSKFAKGPLARLYDRLEEWSAPGSSYPDIAEAFAPFKRPRRSAATKREGADFCETRTSVTALEVAPRTES